MEPLVVTVSHALGREEALRRLKPALGKVSEMFPVLKVDQEVWTGNRLDFSVSALGQVASGNIQVEDQIVRCEVTLPRLLHSFAGIAKRVLASRGVALLGKK